LVRGEHLLRARGYTEEQIKKLPERAYVHKVGGETRIEGLTSSGQVPSDIKGKWVGGVGGWYEVLEPEYRKTTLTEEYTEVILPEREVIKGVGPEVTYRVSPEGEVVGTKRWKKIEKPPVAVSQIRYRPGVSYIEQTPEGKWVPTQEQLKTMTFGPRPVYWPQIERVKAPPEPVPVERKPFRFEPEAAKEYVRREFESPEIERAWETGVGLVAPLHLKPLTLLGTKGMRSAVRSVGWAFGAAGEKYVPERLDIEYRVSPITRGAYVTPTGWPVPPGVVKVRVRKKEALETLAFAGEYAGWMGILQPITAVPKKAPKAYKPLGEHGGIRIFKKKGLKLPTKVQRVEAGKYLEPARGLEYEEKMLERALKPPKFKPKLKVPIKPFKPTVFKVKKPPALPHKLKGRVPELGKYLEPVKPLTYEEKMLERALKPVSKIKAIKFKPIKWKPTIAKPKKVPKFSEYAVKGKMVELTRYLEPKRPLQYEEKVFQKILKAQAKQVVPTTAGLRKAKAMPVKEFALKVEKIVKPPPIKIKPIKVMPKVEETKTLFFMPLIYKAWPRAYYKTKLRPPKTILKPKIKLSPIEKQLKESVVTRPKLGRFIRISPRVREAMRVISIPKPKAKRIVKPAVAVSEIIRIKELDRVKEAEKVLAIPKIREIVMPRERAKAREKQAVREKEIIKQLTKTLPRVFPKAKEPPIYKEPIKVPLPKVPLPFWWPPSPPAIYEQPLASFVAGFIPLTRRAGKVVPLTPFPVSKEAASAIAIMTVAGTPRASYKLLGVGRPARKIAFPRIPFGAARMFMPAKTLPGWMVEKPKYRIREREEMLGIPYAGLKKLAQFPWLRKAKKKRRRKK